MDRIVVVGASLGGLRAAEALRRLGHAGALTVVGEELHEPYDRPPLSKQVLDGRWEPEKTRLRQDEGLDVEWVTGRRATALDIEARTVTLDDGQSIGYDGLVVATGATPRNLPGAAGLAGVFTLRTLDDALALRAAFAPQPKVAVIGAGFIGAEVAASARALGLDVTVIEALAQPLARVLGPELGARCARLHKDNGTNLRLGVGVEGLTSADGRVTGVALADGSTVEADVVVVGIGVTPNTGWLEGSGLAVDNGVVCDASLRAAPDVVAVGDVCRWLHPAYGSMRIEHWSNAAEQAEHAAATLLGDPQPFAPLPYFWSDQYKAKLQYLGHHGPGAEMRVLEGSIDDDRFVAGFHEGDALVAVLLWAWPARLVAWRTALTPSP